MLVLFSNATGLTINYGKCTMTPLHMDLEDVESARLALGCSLGSFPQSYLGLALSTNKLGKADFRLLTAKVDKYLLAGNATCSPLLAGWSSSPLFSRACPHMPCLHFSSLLG